MRKIVYDVNKESIVTAGLTPWNTGVGKPPAKTWKAVVSFIFPQTDQVGDTIEFEGDSAEVIRLLRSAASMLEHLDESYQRELPVHTEL